MKVKQLAGNSASSNALVSEGSHLTVLIGLIDSGSHPTEYMGKQKPPQRQMLFVFEFPNETVEIGGVQVPKILTATVNLTTAEKGKLIEYASSLIGRRLTPPELAECDLSSLIGKAAMVSVVHREYNGRTYANIHTISPPLAGTSVQPSRRIWFMLDDPNTYGAVNDLMDWWIDKINSSTEAIARDLNFKKNAAPFSITTQHCVSPLVPVDAVPPVAAAPPVNVAPPVAAPPAATVPPANPGTASLPSAAPPGADSGSNPLPEQESSNGEDLPF